MTWFPDETGHYQAREGLGSREALQRTSQENIENSLKSSVKTPEKVLKSPGLVSS